MSKSGSSIYYSSDCKFNNAFRKIIGKDEHDSAIEDADPSKFGVTWTQVKAEMDKL